MVQRIVVLTSCRSINFDKTFFAMAEVVGVVASTVSILNFLKAVRLAQPAYDIVLSFRPLQKERIEALQQELLDLIKKRQDLIKDHEDLKRVNELIDAILHVYGMCRMIFCCRMRAN
jgi:hypothetical protein